MWCLILQRSSNVTLSSEEKGMLLSSPWKVVTNCAYILDALKSSVMLRNIFLPGLNSPVQDFYKHRTTFQIAHVFMNSQNASPLPNIHSIQFIWIHTSDNFNISSPSIVSSYFSLPVLGNHSLYHLHWGKASRSFTVSTSCWNFWLTIIACSSSLHLSTELVISSFIKPDAHWPQGWVHMFS